MCVWLQFQSCTRIIVTLCPFSLYSNWKIYPSNTNWEPKWRLRLPKQVLTHAVADRWVAACTQAPTDLPPTTIKKIFLLEFRRITGMAQGASETPDFPGNPGNLTSDINNITRIILLVDSVCIPGKKGVHDNYDTRPPPKLQKSNWRNYEGDGKIKSNPSTIPPLFPS